MINKRKSESCSFFLPAVFHSVTWMPLSFQFLISLLFFIQWIYIRNIPKLWCKTLFLFRAHWKYHRLKRINSSYQIQYFLISKLTLVFQHLPGHGGPVMAGPGLFLTIMNNLLSAEGESLPCSLCRLWQIYQFFHKAVFKFLSVYLGIYSS